MVLHSSAPGASSWTGAGSLCQTRARASEAGVCYSIVIAIGGVTAGYLPRVRGFLGVEECAGPEARADLNGAGSQVLTKAKAQGVPVIAYDRPITGADYYVSFDNTKVGELEGQMVVDGLKKEGKDLKTAKVVCMSGDPTDGNAAFFLKGATKAMSAAGIKCAFSPKGTWVASKSGIEFAQAYTALKGNIDAVWTANDANNAA